uniref:Transmembrane protein 231 n=1 Tax=Syphacia muris TaxID=451379 RepID=A0A0N5AXF1_9BILA
MRYSFKGFWKKYGEYSEQPIVNFKNRFIIILKNPVEYYVWSTYTVVNQAEYNHLKIPVTEYSSDDYNDDGAADKLFMKMVFPLKQNETVEEVFLMVLFDYRIQLRSRISMETALVSNFQLTKSCSKMGLFGKLELDQLIPLPSYGTYRDFDGRLIDEFMSDVRHYTENSIRLRYNNRNFTTRLKREVVSCTQPQSSADNERFILQLEILIPEQRFVYKTGVLELLKWSWIQYLSVFLIFNFLFKKFFKFMIENQILPTAVVYNNTVQQ